MSDLPHTRRSSKKWILIGVGVPVLTAAWWAFRPEKLWITVRVHEAAPPGLAHVLQPLYTGVFGRGLPTTGRASVYRSASDKIDLRLTDLTTPNGPDVHLFLVQHTDEVLGRASGSGALDGIDLGPIGAGQGDQRFDLPAAIDLSRYDTVVVYDQQRRTVLGAATLERF